MFERARTESIGASKIFVANPNALTSTNLIENRGDEDAANVVVGGKRIVVHACGHELTHHAGERHCDGR